MRAREYRPDAGRFLSPDPLGFAAGENPWAFVFDRPLAFGDPFGLSPVRPWYDRSNVLSWIERRYYPPGIARTGYDLMYSRVFDPSRSGWARAGAGLAAAGLAIPAVVEEIGRGIANAPYELLSGTSKIVYGAVDLGRVKSWENRLDRGAQIVTGAVQIVGAAGAVYGAASLAAPLAEGVGSQLSRLAADETGALFPKAATPFEAAEGAAAESVNLASTERTAHILVGDATGGGHLWPGALGKTPFPQGWSGEQIMHSVSDIATDPALTWVQQTGQAGSLFTRAGDPARFFVIGERAGVQIKVILEPAGEGIITAFPMGGTP
jgi:hypothetical protein